MLNVLLFFNTGKKGAVLSARLSLSNTIVFRYQLPATVSTPSGVMSTSTLCEPDCNARR